MSGSLKYLLAQLNPTVGAIDANAERIRAVRMQAMREGADLLLVTEMSITGYPPEDLVQKPAFIRAVNRAVDALVAETADGGPGILLSVPRMVDGELRNALVLADKGKILKIIPKHHLPNYGVFDEKRVFTAGSIPEPAEFRGHKLGLLTCEDMWFPDIPKALADAGAEIIIAPHGSPFEAEKPDTRLNLARERVSETGLPLVLLNQVGGQDELIFDGSSFVLDRKGDVIGRLPAFVEGHACLEMQDADTLIFTCEEATPILEGDELIYMALMVALRDYVDKNGFPGVIVGLSGGADSALTAAIAVDALGSDRVRTVMMPYKYTSEESVRDAADCAEALGTRHDIIDIHDMVDAFFGKLNPYFEGLEPDSTEENIQARVRAIILMALSNKFGDMVVATGNKSEFSVGYSTLYGDLCGGYALLKDLYKTKVYALAHWRNERKPQTGLGPEKNVIPVNILTKPPSAELKPDQKDRDSLPPYPVLDSILHGLIEEELSNDDIVGRGQDPETVARVEHLLYLAEYKRRQAPPGVKVTRKQFGRDRRYPITNRYRTAMKGVPAETEKESD